jgi:DNA-binding response OmpR family regulator
MKNKKILVIDDTKDLNDMFALAFECEGCFVRQSFDGKDGFAVYKEFQPDVILLDIMMPEMDGNEVLAHIQEEGDPQPLIIIFSNMEWKGETSEHVRYIKKSSITPTEMVEQVKKMM